MKITSFLTQKTERKMIFELSLILQDLGKVVILLEWIFYAANFVNFKIRPICKSVFGKDYLL